MSINIGTKFTKPSNTEKLRNFKTKSSRDERFKITSEAAITSKKAAQVITLLLIENEICHIEDFKEQIKFITPEQYDDVSLERSLSGICGYPLCSKSVLKEVENKSRFIIRHNKVYDITKRKNFCSDVCYQASEIILQQIPSVPLYLRGVDDEVKNLVIKVPNRNRLNGFYGKKINIKGSCFEHENNFEVEIPSDNEDDDQSREACEDDGSMGVTCEEENSKHISKNKKVSFGVNKTIHYEPPSNEDDEVTQLNRLSLDESKSLNDLSPDTNTNIKYDEKHKDLFNKTKNIKVSPIDTKQLIEMVQNYMREWITYDSLRAILGDTYVRGMLEHIGKAWEDYDTTVGLQLGVESKSKYIALCKKLDREEIQDEILAAVEDEEETQKPRKSFNVAPNYEQLERDVNNQTFKVKAFFDGSLEYSEQLRQHDELPLIQEQNETKVVKTDEKMSKFKRTNKSKSLKKELDLDSMTLPIIDTYEQNVWRRNILLDKINKSFSTLCCDLGLDEGHMRNIVKPIIATFDLTPQNIVLKTAQWHLVSLVFLKLLSVRYPIVNTAMTNEKGRTYIGNLLMNSNLDPCYLDRLLSYLTEINYVLTKYHQQRPYFNSVTSEAQETAKGKPDVENINKIDVGSITNKQIGSSISDDIGNTVKDNIEPMDISSVGNEPVVNNIMDCDNYTEYMSTNYMDLD